jgi:3-methylfumaryl-CoA hydratase
VIENVSAKEGRSGPLVFVKVRHEITPAGAQAAALTEHQDLVYRAAHDPAEAPPAPRPAPEPAAFQRTWVADDVLLFRYSALTFNGHRIHYDRRYVTQAEGYPGLVVHGPLIATLLVQVLLEAHPGARLRRFEFRALRPLFDGAPFSVCGAPQAEPGHFRLWARDPAGWLAMDASALID